MSKSRDGGPVFQPQTELGSKLWELRQQIIASGEPLLDAAQVEDEVDRRRGADVLVTTEKRSKAFHRVKRIEVHSLSENGSRC